MKRRFFLFAAPAIVAAPSLMRVSTLPEQLRGFQSLTLSNGSIIHFDATAIHDNKMYFLDMSRLMYADGGNLLRRTGLGAMFTDEEYERLVMDDCG